MAGTAPLTKHPRIDPRAIDGSISLTDLVDQTFLAYNAARLRECCHLFTHKMLADDVTVGLSLTGALTPAGVGIASVIPLIENGFVDWIVSTGANLYHDLHWALGFDMHRGSPFADDIELRKSEVIRIYDILFDYDVLLKTDAFCQEVLRAPEFQRTMSTSEFHWLFGAYAAAREEALGTERRSVLAAAREFGVPVYTSSPGDSSIGLNVAALALDGNKLAFDVSADVNETAGIVLDAKLSGGKSAVVLIGGGSPKNFVLQTEPQIQEVLQIEEKGHDYFLQITDARPDTGGLSGATPGEAVSWGKVDPDQLADSTVCYLDATIGLPILTAYAMAKHGPRGHRRLYDRRGELIERLKRTTKRFFREGGLNVEVEV